MIWHLTDKGDAEVLAMANRHYPRQTHDSNQFVAPGRSLVLRIGAPLLAYWVTLEQRPEFTRHAWPGAWICAAFRNEGGGLSSELIRDAVAATRAEWGDPPEAGMVTFVDEAATGGRRSPRHPPGRCFLCAGFAAVGRTKRRGLVALQLPPGAFPDAARARIPGVLGLGRAA